MVLQGFTPDQTKRALDHYETVARTLFQRRGHPDPGSDQIGSIVSGAAAGATPEELRGGISTATLGRIDQLVARAVEAGQPRNIHSAAAARLAQLAPEKAAAFDLKTFAAMQRARAQARAEARGDRDGGGGASGERGSGARYDSLGSTEWNSASGQAITRSYAVANNMSWATREPDLMRMGKPALQALHETHLQGDGYKALRDPSGLRFDNGTIVKGAGYMKAVQGDYNRAAKAMAAVDKAETHPELRQEHKAAVRDLLHSDAGNRKERQKRLYDVGEKQKKADPRIAPKVDEERQQLHVEHGAALKHEAKAEAKDSAAKDKDMSAVVRQQKKKSAAANALALLS